MERLYIEAWARATTRNLTALPQIIELRKRTAEEDGAPRDALFKQGDEWTTLRDLRKDNPSLANALTAADSYRFSEQLRILSFTSKSEYSTVWADGHFDGPDFAEHITFAVRKWPGGSVVDWPAIHTPQNKIRYIVFDANGIPVASIKETAPC